MRAGGEPTSGAREERFDEVWRENAAAVMRYARRRVDPDDVEEVLADTFLLAWRRLDEVPAFPLPWLLGVARGTAANARRARLRRSALHDRVTRHADPRTAHDPDMEPVTAALETLSSADRELLTLLAWEGLSHEEAAEALGCSRSALAVRLHRARRRLAAAMGTAPPGAPLDAPPTHTIQHVQTFGGVSS